MGRYFFLFLFLMVGPLWASHIVGGEFELLHIKNYNYYLNLIYYFDEKNGEQGAKDPVITVSIFSVRDGSLIANVSIPLIQQTPVSYTQPACANGIIITSRQFYSTVITLSPDIYNDPQGYYVVWERCCRNYTIRNIINQKPGPNDTNPPNVAGQTFYLKFPPVILNGVQFINSSPHLFPPLSDYGCQGRPYYVNFAGVDDDNDSLVYSMTTPFDTQDHNPLPVIGPAPYPDVRWKSPYSLTNIMDGQPDLRISKNGLLTVTPLDTGLFVFAVKVEEFRNGVKIGESRRDFQLYVAYGCQPDQPPQIVGRKITDSNFNYVDTISVSFPDTLKNYKRCIVVRVSDPDSQDPLHNYTQNISLRTIALNENANSLGNVLPSVTKATLKNGSTADFNVCFLPCTDNNPYVIGIIAMDDACSLPLTDTLVATINENVRPNTPPYFLPVKNISATVTEGSSNSWNLNAQDDDGDPLLISILPNDFLLKDAGMSFNYSAPTPDIIKGIFNWNAFCKNYEFSKKTDFTVDILVDDQDPCNLAHYDTATLQLKVILPEFDPKLKIYNEDKTQNLTNNSVEMNLGHIVFDVEGTDTNTLPIDSLKLSLLSVDGNAVVTGYNFVSVTGVHDVQSFLVWDPTCSIFKDGTYDNNYTFTFLVENDHCKTPSTDTAYVNLRIKDIESTDKGFLPANVITTFPDHCNDFFAIEGFESEPDCDGQTRIIPLAPADNCTNRFERVKIFDRWGKLVFESTDRKFRWYAQNESAGVYYYIIYFTKAHYKSSLTVIH